MRSFYERTMSKSEIHPAKRIKFRCDIVQMKVTLTNESFELSPLHRLIHEEL